MNFYDTAYSLSHESNLIAKYFNHFWTLLNFVESKSVTVVEKKFEMSTMESFLLIAKDIFHLVPSMKISWSDLHMPELSWTKWEYSPAKVSKQGKAFSFRTSSFFHWRQSRTLIDSAGQVSRTSSKNAYGMQPDTQRNSREKLYLRQTFGTDKEL